MRTQIKNSADIRGKVLEDIRLYPWQSGAVVLLFKNDEAAIFNISEYEDSLALDILRTSVFQNWDYESLYYFGLITEDEYEKEKVKHDEKRKKERFQQYKRLKDEFENG